MPPKNQKQIRQGDTIPLRTIEALRESIQIPDKTRVIHLQFRRFAGCPICDYHLRQFVTRKSELEQANVLEVIVFHSTRKELETYEGDLPLVAVPDPEKKLYKEFGADRTVFMSFARWGPTKQIPFIMANIRRLPNFFPTGGRSGIVADFLIAPNAQPGQGGKVVAAKYGQGAVDHWSVDDVLGLVKQA